MTELEYANDHMAARGLTESGVTVRFAASFINNASCGNHNYRVFGAGGIFRDISPIAENNIRRERCSIQTVYTALPD
ncbi:MAG: hypothetical protein V8T87_03660 [Victivallales bacterium]